MRALHHNTRKICHHNLQHRADLREEEDWRAHPEAKWPSYKINQRVWHYINARRDELEVRTIMGKPRHWGEGTDHPTKTQKNQDVTQKGEESQRRMNRRTKTWLKRTETTTQQQKYHNRRKHKSKTKRENKEKTNRSKTPNRITRNKKTTEPKKDEEDKQNTKRYNLRKRKGRTVYVSAWKVFGLDNLRDTDDVIEAMKRGYEVSIGGSCIARSGGGGNDSKAKQNRQSADRPGHGQRWRPPTTAGHAWRPNATTTTKTTKDANQPSKVQRTRDQGQRKSVREAEPA
jgi:hypothetical protein